MSVSINVKVTGLESTRRAFNNLAEKINNPDDKLMKRIGDTLLEDTDRRFKTRGYGTWPEDSPETVKRKGHGNVLIKTGAMMSSTKITRQGNTVKLTVPYGGKKRSPDVPEYHQEGTRRMPQRKIVAVTTQLTSALAATLTIWIRDVVAAFQKGI
jgi:phage gpG-like protein